MSSSFLVNANLRARLGDPTSHALDDFADDWPNPRASGFLEYRAWRAAWIPASRRSHACWPVTRLLAGASRQLHLRHVLAAHPRGDDTEACCG